MLRRRGQPHLTPGPRGPGRTVTSIAKLLGVSVGTLYNHIPDLQRAGDTSEPPAAVTES
ncbi:hypothetical protein [Nonomuraea bangladeshensis]|uniref:hypothetical protein n=1 Tax=Nonomuraea bangladeshensis TaxID=404385 RepID=UPI003C304BC0